MTDALSSRLLEAIERAVRDELGALLETKTAWSLGDDGVTVEVHCECGWLRSGDDEGVLDELTRGHLADHGEPGSALRLCQAHREIVEMYQDLDRRPRAGFMGDLERASANAKIVTLGLVLQALAKAYGIEEEDSSGHSE